jgi:pimeloyl-ACP methyl ester carboxylesterase
MIGLRIAAHHPELISALVLGDSMLLSKGFHPDSMYPSLFAGLRDLAAQDLLLEQMADGLSRIKLKVPGLKEKVCIGDLPGNDRTALLRWAPCVMQADPDTYQMTLDGSSFEEWNGESLLAQARCPILLLQASPELGALMSDADVAAAKRLVRDVTHVRFSTLGHALYIQQPEPIIRAVNEFLARIVMRRA